MRGGCNAEWKRQNEALATGMTQWSFRNTETMRTLVRQAEIGV